MATTDTEIGPSAVSLPQALWVALTYAVMGALALLPILSVEIPSLLDYPNHLARMHVIATQGTDHIVQQNYAVEWRPLPNLAMDLIVPPMIGPLSAIDAGRVFLVMGMISVMTGICALHWAIWGRMGLSPIAGFLLLYNLPLAWGFVNFYFSIGLSLLIFAGWISTRGWPIAVRLLLFNLVTTALYFSHLFGLAAYVIMIACYELQRAWFDRAFTIGGVARRALIAGSQLILPALLFLANALLWKQAIAPLELGSWFGSPMTKGTALLSAFFFNGGPADVFPLILAAVILIIASRQGWVKVAPMMRWPLAGFFLITLATPHVLNGLFLDARIGVFLGCLLVAALRFEIPQARAVQFMILLVAVFGLKMVSVAQVWRSHDATYADFRDASRAISPGARVLSVHDVPGARAELTYDTQWSMGGILGSHGTSRLFAERGMINLTVLERGAFVPSLFTYSSAQPLRSADQHLHIDPVFPARRVTTPLFLAGIDPEASANLSAIASAHQEIPFWINWPAHFDYVVVQKYAYEPTPLPDVLVSVHTSAYFDIYKIRHAD